jgi:TonB family protein
MQEASTQVLIDRSREAEGLGATVLLSLFAHATIIAALVVMPASWRAGRNEPSHTMMISLGGAPGPRQGLTPMATRPIQEVAATPKGAPITPPAAKAPEMVEPLKNARPQPKAAEKVEKPARQPASKPVTGPEIRSGAARVETGGQATPFGGLGTGGGGAGAAYTDFQNFCCPDYLITMTQIIQRNWQQHQNLDGTVVVKFTIHRDGSIDNVEVEKPNAMFLNMASQRAIADTKRLPPLPAAFTEDHLTVHLVFQYKR